VTLLIVAASCPGSLNLVRHQTPSIAQPAPVSMVQEGVMVNVSSAVIHSAPASDTDIAPILRQALRRITSLLPGLNARVDIAVDPENTIHEIGMGGSTDPDTGDVTIAVDPAPKKDLVTGPIRGFCALHGRLPLKQAVRHLLEPP